MRVTGTMKEMDQGRSEAGFGRGTLYHYWFEGSRTVGSLLARRGILDWLYQYMVVISVRGKEFDENLVNRWFQHSGSRAVHARLQEGRWNRG